LIETENRLREIINITRVVIIYRKFKRQEVSVIEIYLYLI